jgi:two-component system, OmpR family, sensor histidine kinase KdpD
MNPVMESVKGASARRPDGRKHVWVSVSLWTLLVVAAIGITAYLLHFNLSAVGSLYLVLVVLISLRWGFAQATVASIMAVVCMNYFFVPPIFEFQVADPENWISLGAFETAALVVSGLSHKVLQHAAQTEAQRERTAKLYELSRAILLIDGKISTTEQLGLLIREVVHVADVELWVTYDTSGSSTVMQPADSTGGAFEAFKGDSDDYDDKTNTTRRILRVGTTPIGAMVLHGWEHDSLLADAVASMAAVAIERARAIHKENRAEAERNTEQLRTAVLDGLAHGFKTPLTAIQTASSGLLAIEHLTPVQTELVTLIDEQATKLALMTTRLLQTAKLESRDIRIRRSRTSIHSLILGVIEAQDLNIRNRLKLVDGVKMISIDVDTPMMESALLQLIDNAAKYSAVGKEITVRLRQTEEETTVIVENYGPPIQKEEQSRIFERFYRGEAAVRGPSGTGLGLSIAKKTAEAHGGRVWVECTDEITRFFFSVENYRGTIDG